MYEKHERYLHHLKSKSHNQSCYERMAWEEITRRRKYNPCDEIELDDPLDKQLKEPKISREIGTTNEIPS